MSDKEKNEINYKKVNEVVSLSSKILKIFYLLIIILGIYGITLIIEKWKIMEFIGSILKILTPAFIGFVVYWLFVPNLGLWDALAVACWVKAAPPRPQRRRPRAPSCRRGCRGASRWRVSRRPSRCRSAAGTVASGLRRRLWHRLPYRRPR